MPDAGAKAGTFEGALFASVLDDRARRAGDRARTLWVMPLVLGLHAVALLGLTVFWHGSGRGGPSATADGEALVLRLLAAPPPPPAATPATASPASVTRRTVARRARPFPKPTLPQPTVPPEEALEAAEPPSPPDPVAEASSAHLASTDAAGVPGGVAGGVVGGLVQGVLGASNPGLLLAPPPPRLTEEQLSTWREQYFETMFRDRFENVRYPHQAAMAGIQGKLVVRISVGARGQLLGLEISGRCPHSVLCDAALQAVRDAAPFPAPPPELGGRVTVELPFNYHLR